MQDKSNYNGLDNSFYNKEMENSECLLQTNSRLGLQRENFAQLRWIIIIIIIMIIIEILSY